MKRHFHTITEIHKLLLRKSLTVALAGLKLCRPGGWCEAHEDLPPECWD